MAGDDWAEFRLNKGKLHKMFRRFFHRRLFILTCLLLVPGCATTRAGEPLKVLFIGNSYTYVNDLPSLIEGLADAAGGRKIQDRKSTRLNSSHVKISYAV